MPAGAVVSPGLNSLDGPRWLIHKAGALAGTAGRLAGLSWDAGTAGSLSHIVSGLISFHVAFPCGISSRIAGFLRYKFLKSLR